MYVLYGCRVRADGPLAGLPTVSGSDVDVTVTIDSPPPPPQKTGPPIYHSETLTIWCTDAGHFFTYADATEFLVSPSGDHVTAWTPSGATREEIGRASCRER